MWLFSFSFFFIWFTDRFPSVEPSLHFWNEAAAHLSIEDDDFFVVFSDSVCQHFIECLVCKHLSLLNLYIAEYQGKCDLISEILYHAHKFMLQLFILLFAKFYQRFTCVCLCVSMSV